MGLIAQAGLPACLAIPKKGYPWGSNSFVLTNAMMLVLAYDFTKDAKYLNGVATGHGLRARAQRAPTRRT